MLSLLNYDKGDIELFGKKMTPTSYDIKRRIGIISQNVAVFDELTVYENIDYFCGLYIRDKELRNQRIDAAIDFTGLGDFVKFRPKKAIRRTSQASQHCLRNRSQARTYHS